MAARPAAAITAAALGAAALWVAAGCTSTEPQRRSEGAPGAGRVGAEPAAVDRAAAGPRLLLAGHGALWEVDVRAERARRLRVPGLSGGDTPYRIVRRGGRFVVWSGGTYVTGTKLDAADPLGPLARRAWFFLPSTRPGRVWLTYIDRNSSATNFGFRAVREVTAT